MLKLKLIIIALILISCNFAYAQTDHFADVRSEIFSWQTELTRIQAASTRDGTDPQKHINELIVALAPLSNTAKKLDDAILPSLAVATTKLAQLGDAPKDGTLEDENVREQRSALNKEVRILNDLQKQIRLYETETNQLIKQLIEKKRTLASQYLFAKNDTIFNVKSLFYNIQSMFLHLISLGKITYDTFDVLLNAANWQLGFVVAFITGVFFLVPFLKKKAREKIALSQKNYFNNMPHLWAVLIIILDVFIATFGSIVCVQIVSQLILLPERFSEYLSRIPYLVGLISFANAFQDVVFSPRAIERALLAMPSVSEQKILANAVHQLGALHTLAFFIMTTKILVVPSFEALSAMKLLYCSAALSIFAVFFVSLGKAEDKREADALEASPIFDEDTVLEQISPQKWVLFIRPLLASIFLVIVSAVILGYYSFGQFVLIQASISFIFLVALKTLVKIIEEIVQPLTLNTSYALRKISRTTGVPENSIIQSATLISGVFQFLILIIGGLLIISVWSGEGDRVFLTIYNIFSGFKVGNLTISVSSILQAFAVFFSLLFIWKLVQRWLKTKLIANLPLETGLKDSLDIVFGYGGAIIAFLMAFSSLGVSLDNLAVIAGALSVGIGFGLQSIVNNFVSGLILLAERPIKLGDWIVVGEDEGYVRKIKVRSTEIETFNNSTIIIPNSTLISGSVKNLMHHNVEGRCRIQFTISSNADPEIVSDVLLSCAKNHAKILKRPAPAVYLLDIDYGNFVMELSFLVGDVNTSYTVRSELRFEITKAFRESGIEFASRLVV